MAGNAFRLASAQVGATDAKAAENGGRSATAVQHRARCRSHRRHGKEPGDGPYTGYRTPLDWRHRIAHGFSRLAHVRRSRESVAAYLLTTTNKPAGHRQIMAMAIVSVSRSTYEAAAEGTALDPEDPHSAVYLTARREWNERYGSYISQRDSWRLVALAAMGVAAIAVAGNVWQSSQSHVVPFVVEVNHLGDALPIKRADVAAPANPRRHPCPARPLHQRREVHLYRRAGGAGPHHKAYAMVDRGSAPPTPSSTNIMRPTTRLRGPRMRPFTLTWSPFCR